MIDESLKVHITGRWRRSDVTVRWAPSTYRSSPQSERLIEQAWHAAKRRLGEKLFDGPMARLEGFVVGGSDGRLSNVDCGWSKEGQSPEQYSAADSIHSTINARQSTLELFISRTSYRIFLGTNMANPELADSIGVATMANPIGVSTGLITADRFLMFGRRSDNVAYYPHMIHPFAGSLEVGGQSAVGGLQSAGDTEKSDPDSIRASGPDSAPPTADCRPPTADPPDLFANALRELHEELGLAETDIADIACRGIVEDRRLRHPETIFIARTNRTRKEIEQSLLGDEHTGTWNCPATTEGFSAALVAAADFTPVARAVLAAARTHVDFEI